MLTKHASIRLFSHAAPALCAERLEKSIKSANWGDSLRLVQDMPFWESACMGLEKIATNSPTFSESPQFKDAMRCLDAVCRCEDVRDYTNELIEALDRLNHRESTTFTPTKDLEEAIELILAEWAKLKKEYPELEEKVNESVGKGLKLLRSRYKFNWADEHRAYY